MARQWWVRIAGKTLGPINDAQLASLAKAGKLTADADVATAGCGPWHKAGRIKGLPFAVATVPTSSATIPQPMADASTTLTATTVTQSHSLAMSSSAASFREWYRVKIGYQWLLTQGLLWMCLGFIWIPLWWVLTRSTMTQSRALAEARQRRLPILSYAILGFISFAVTFVAVRPIVDPLGHKEFLAAMARRAGERAREAASSRAQEAVRQQQATPVPTALNNPEVARQLAQLATHQQGVQVSRGRPKGLFLEQLLAMVKCGMAEEEVRSLLGPPDQSRETQYMISLNSQGEKQQVGELSAFTVMIPGREWAYHDIIINPDTRRADESIYITIGSKDEKFVSEDLGITGRTVPQQGLKGKVLSRKWSGSRFDPYHLPDEAGRQ